MNTYGPLFEIERHGEAYARSSDPDTSHEAAEDMKGNKANRLESRIVTALKAHPNGLTNHGIVEVTGLTWNTATPRIAPLVRKNLIVDSGERRMGPSGKSCIVWKAI